MSRPSIVSDSSGLANGTNIFNATAHVSVDQLTSDFLHEVFPLAVLTGVIALFGVFGNSSVLYVHLFKYRRCNFRYFVLGLCVVDFVGCLIALPMQMYAQVYHFDYRYSVVCKTAAFFNVSTCIAMTYILFMIAVDRFRKICAPHGWQLRRIVVRRGLVGIVFLSVLQSFPVTIVWGINRQVVFYNGSWVRVSYCGPDESLKDTFWPHAYIMSLIPNFILMAVMLVLYAIIFQRLLRARARCAQLSQHCATTDSKSNAYGDPHTPGTGDHPRCLLRDTSNDAATRTRTATESGTSWYVDLNDDDNVDEADDEAYDHSVDSVIDDRRTRAKRGRNVKIRRTTILTFVFTICFICTELLYMVLASIVANTRDRAQKTVSLEGTVLFLFGYRLFYVNYAMHPIIYGFMDRHFRQSLHTIQQNVSNYIMHRPSVINNECRATPLSA